MKLTATASKTKKRKVNHIRIHRAANGFTVHHELEPKLRSPGMPYSPMDDDPKPSVFADKQAMLDHVGSLADQMGGNDAGAPAPDQTAAA